MNLYSDAEKEKEVELRLHRDMMEEWKTKLKTSLDVGQSLLVTLNNMNLDKLKTSTPGMNDVQRLQWANAEITNTLMPTIKKQMSEEKDDYDTVSGLTKTVLSNLLTTLCQNILVSNSVQLGSAEK